MVICLTVQETQETHVLPWVWKIPWSKKWQPLQYSCLGNPMDREAWQAPAYWVAKSQIRLSMCVRVCVCVCVCVHQRSQILPYANCYYLVAKLSDSFETPWTVAHLATLSMGFSRHEYCSGLPFPSPEDLPDSGIETESETGCKSLKLLVPKSEFFVYCYYTH